MLRHRGFLLHVAFLPLICLSTCGQALLAQEQAPLVDQNPSSRLGEDAGAFAIIGSIIDKSGAAVPNVQVVATNLGTHSTHQTTADSSGHFVVMAVPLGRYHIRAIVPGFEVKDAEIDVLPNDLNSVTLTVSKKLVPAIAHAPQSNGKPTEQVVVQYEQIIASGALLTPEGWRRAGKLFGQSNAYPPDGEISLISTGGSVGEMWLEGDRAEVQTKWTDYMGTIDSALRYEPPASSADSIMTLFVFHLVYTNKHRDIGTSGETSAEVVGPWEWKIEGPQNARWATVDRAVEYVIQMRDKSENLAVKKNADKTIAALQRMRGGCGSARAC